MPLRAKRCSKVTRQANRRRSRRLSWKRLRWRVARLTSGGRWTDRLRPPIRRNLRWFIFDGIFARSRDSILLAYLSLYILALGATRVQIGLMSALSSLVAALLLLPGATLVERRGRRKPVVVFVGGGGTHAALLLLALVPLVFHGPAAVYAAIALVVVHSGFGNLALPAWIALTADVVPLRWRGRYFSFRNIAMGVAGMAVTYLVGRLITGIGAPLGYQLAIGLAFGVGLVSLFCFAHIAEPPVPTRRAADGGGRVFRALRAQPGFVAFCATSALWNLALNLAGPFFGVYLVEGLQASASVVGALSVVGSLAALPGQRLFGLLADRWGERRLQLVTGLIIPLLPMAWALVGSPWHAVPINLAGGFLWAGYNLAAFNLLLSITPRDQRPRYSAIYQITVTVALAGGAALGGVIATYWGYKTLFVLSGLGRLLAALLFARFVFRPTPTGAAEQAGQPGP